MIFCWFCDPIFVCWYWSDLLIVNTTQKGWKSRAISFVIVPNADAILAFLKSVNLHLQGKPVDNLTHRKLCIFNKDKILLHASLPSCRLQQGSKQQRSKKHTAVTLKISQGFALIPFYSQTLRVHYAIIGNGFDKNTICWLGWRPNIGRFWLLIRLLVQLYFILRYCTTLMCCNSSNSDILLVVM